MALPLCVAVTVYVVDSVAFTEPVISPVLPLMERLPGRAGETVHVVEPLSNGGWKPIGSMVTFSQPYVDCRIHAEVQLVRGRKTADWHKSVRLFSA